MSCPVSGQATRVIGEDSVWSVKASGGLASGGEGGVEGAAGLVEEAVELDA